MAVFLQLHSAQARAVDRSEAGAEPQPAVQVQGTLVPVGDQPLGDLEVTVFAPGDTSSTVTSDGSFSLSVDASQNTLRIEVDAPLSEERTFHPALFRAPTSDLESGVTLMMIPLQWTIQKGEYAGETVDISIYKAFSTSERSESFYLGGYTSDFGATPYRWFGSVERWRPQDRPIPIQMRNETPDYQELTEEDSTAFWNAVGKIESTFGRDLFRAPTSEDPDWTPDEDPPEGTIGVAVDSSWCALGYSYSSSSDESWDTGPFAETFEKGGPGKYRSIGGYISHGYNGYCHDLFDRLEDDTDYVRESARRTIIHELFHAMGFGHGCLIPSRMTYTCKTGVQTIRTFDVVIPSTDVAYWELRSAAFRKVESEKNEGEGSMHRARFVFLPALAGERRIMRGLRPIPSREEWENVAGKKVENTGTYEFGDLGVSMEFFSVDGVGRVQARTVSTPPVNYKGISEKNIADRRVIITSQKYRFSGRAYSGEPRFDVGSDTELHVNLGLLEGIDDPSEVQIYRRSWTDRADFKQLETTYSASSDELVVQSDQFGELAFASDSSPLPVELASFEAQTDAEAVRLSWATASETNNAGFRIQRKDEGKNGRNGEWTTVGSVEGKGTTAEAQRYRFTDDDLPYEADKLTYRLKQVDTDGTENFSDEVVVERGVAEVELLGTYPNPAQSQTTVRYALPDKQKATIRLYDVLGRQVQTVLNKKQEGRHQRTLDVGALPSGVYFLRLRAGGETETQRLTVVQ